MSKSRKLFQETKQVISGGVNNPPARAFSAVNNDPLFIDRGDGALIYDVDGNEYIDYVGSWGKSVIQMLLQYILIIC